MKKKDKFNGHPFELDYDVISYAFKALKKDQENNLMILRGYNGIAPDAYEQHEYESNRIKEVEALVKGWYKDELKKRGVEITYK